MVLHSSAVDLFQHTHIKVEGINTGFLSTVLSFSLPPYSFETQRNGLVFIYDMAGSNYNNFELDLSKKILNLLKVVFTIPTHLNRLKIFRK